MCGVYTGEYDTNGFDRMKEVIKLIEDVGCDVQWNGSIKQQPTINWSI
jgi:hypothetical protein